jgi:porin
VSGGHVFHAHPTGLEAVPSGTALLRDAVVVLPYPARQAPNPTVAPRNDIYASYGLFDGNIARGVQTGLNLGADFNTYKFHIGEVGYAWRVRDQGQPGRIGAGGWGRTGKLLTPNFTFEDGANGFYVLGSQRLWYQHPGIDPSGLIGFFQYGYTDSRSAEVTHYAGAGLAALGLIPKRPADSMGVSLAWADLNDARGAGAFFFPNVPSASTSLRPPEFMWQASYQLVLIP